MKTAIILGATGLVGGLVLQLLLEDDRYKKVIVFSRRACGVKHAKLEEHFVDLFNLESSSNQFKADVVFCCVGTTKAKTPDKDIYTNIDYGIPVMAAQMCKRNNINTFIVVSALGANVNSSVFYSRLKGDMEHDVLDQKVENTFLLQPSLIAGNREEKRLGESLAKWLMRVINPLLVGKLKKYQSIKPETIARAMVWLDNNVYNEKRIPSDKIKSIANLNDRN
ncbi:NAD(P)H-binding protein [Aestuariibaculum lutulentum]|uniref:NAD(P)H-binding protein n=1 Tax=Aestuariibaculum lutulentum TaxID=2920935 RepID=A0ABS9RH65_9FLAO|nr:NAD(P)H-binding protein [Aestuariibaculum lutulentum]MCH4552295.1 NAD(P)H-binding protein [Aestuariibaculum lutulentum]